jgi:hypothetical protein
MSLWQAILSRRELLKVSGTIRAPRLRISVLKTGF